jgi:putative transcriptional regulator
MSKENTSPAELARYGVSAEAWERMRAMTDAEVEAAAVADPDAQPSTPEQLARMRQPSLVKRVRQNLRLGQEAFATAYGIPLEKLRAWERHEFVATEVEQAYLKLIEREPERSRIVSAVAAE